MRAIVIFIITCLLAAFVPLLPKKSSRAEYAAFPGWPTHLSGQPLQSLPLTQGELRFEEEFPGRLGKFSDGQREIALRWIAEPTRLLHPATDCLKGAGYLVRPLPLSVDEAGQRWGCLEAKRQAGEIIQTIRVRERLYDSAGHEWTDVSAWYWAALSGQTSGPWWAVTVAERMP